MVGEEGKHDCAVYNQHLSPNISHPPDPLPHHHPPPTHTHKQTSMHMHAHARTCTHKYRHALVARCQRALELCDKRADLNIPCSTGICKLLAQLCFCCGSSVAQRVQLSSCCRCGMLSVI